MVDIYTAYEQKEAQEIAAFLNKHNIPNKIEEASASLQAYTPALVTYIIKVEKEVENEAHELIDDLFDGD